MKAAVEATFRISAAVSLQHRFEEQPGERGVRDDIDAHDVELLVKIRVAELVLDQQACIVHQQIDGNPRIVQLVENGLWGIGVCKIGRDDFLVSVP